MRELLTKYDFPGDDTPVIVRVSAEGVEGEGRRTIQTRRASAS
jgi:translation elongation factor EF-Tu-like GTPase